VPAKWLDPIPYCEFNLDNASATVGFGAIGKPSVLMNIPLFLAASQLHTDWMLHPYKNRGKFALRQGTASAVP